MKVGSFQSLELACFTVLLYEFPVQTLGRYETDSGYCFGFGQLRVFSLLFEVIIEWYLQFYFVFNKVLTAYLLKHYLVVS